METDYRSDIDVAGMPERIKRLPIFRGFPTPWFVFWQDGVPEFRAADSHKFSLAIMEKRCWVCGEVLGGYRVFVLGPMCGVNRTTSEPPCHAECAQWSAKNCPFLVRPHMVRREGDVPEDFHSPGGIPILRNPGVTLLWWTRSYELFKPPAVYGGGRLIRIGKPERVMWYAEGRQATRAEVLEAIETGLPNLRAACDLQPLPWDKREAHASLTRQVLDFEPLYPAA